MFIVKSVMSARINHCTPYILSMKCAKHTQLTQNKCFQWICWMGQIGRLWNVLAPSFHYIRLTDRKVTLIIYCDFDFETHTLNFGDDSRISTMLNLQTNWCITINLTEFLGDSFELWGQRMCQLAWRPWLFDQHPTGN